MTAKRDDIHRPSAILPSDYVFVGFEHVPGVGQGDLGACQYQIRERERIRAHMKRTGGTYSGHEHGGNCMVCGSVNAIYTILYYHEKSNTYVRMGQDCAQKADMSLDEGAMNLFRTALRDARTLHAGKRKAQAILHDAGLDAAWAIYTADYNDLPKDKRYNGQEVLFYEENAVRDIVGRLVEYGSVSEKTMSFLGSLPGKIAHRAELLAQREAERDAALPVPTGRITVTGTVLKVVTEETKFGLVTKMTVKSSDGWLFKSTVPKGLVVERGSQITITVTMKASKNDPKFGWGNRPSLVREKVAKVKVAKSESAIAASAMTAFMDKRSEARENGLLRYDF